MRPGLQDALLSTRIPPSQFDAEPTLAYFRPWFEDRARSTYLSYLVSHPSVSLSEPLSNFDLLIAPKRSLPLGLDYFRPPGLTETLSRARSPGFCTHRKGGWLRRPCY